jgi:cytochrome c
MSPTKLEHPLLTMSIALSAMLMASLQVRANEADYNIAMLKLATQSGCTSCHGILPAPERADGLAPIAPAWRDISIKYRDDPGASNRLTRAVMQGSDPGSTHWAGRIGVVRMPPNAIVVTESDARMLVNWILVLVP